MTEVTIKIKDWQLHFLIPFLKFIGVSVQVWTKQADLAATLPTEVTDFYQGMQIDVQSLKFDREEANER